MRITGLDIESTGLSQPAGDRIIEIALLHYDFGPSGPTLIEEWVQRINPEMPIHAKAQEVHGITFAELQDQPTWAEVAPAVHARIMASDLVVAHNMDFDGPFVGGELVRAGFSIPPHVEWLCTMENARWATANGKSPRLEELCFALNLEFDRAKAHGAGYDTQRMMACFFAGLQRGFYTLPDALTIAPV